MRTTLTRVIALLALLGVTASTSAAPGTASTPAPAKPKAPAVKPLKIGVTLHPYFSWTANIVAGVPGVEVRNILPGEVDAGNYQPAPAEIQRLADLDALVVNGIGHDDFIGDMVKASGNSKVVIIRPNDVTPQLRSVRGGAPNSHTFISFGNAIQQTYAIEKALSALRPQLAPAFRKNAAEYARRLRKLKAAAATRLAEATITRVVTVHDGYSYLLHELGIELAGVVEPAHGLTPSAKELGDMIKLMKGAGIKVVLSEESFPPRLLATLQKATGARVYIISHVATGAYTAEKFEVEMQRNVDALVKALALDPPK